MRISHYLCSLLASSQIQWLGASETNQVRLMAPLLF